MIHPLHLELETAEVIKPSTVQSRSIKDSDAGSNKIVIRHELGRVDTSDRGREISRESDRKR